MKSLITKLAIISALIFPLIPAATAGESTAGTEIGILTCKTVPDSTVNLVIHSTASVRCNYVSTDGSGVEHYVGETGVGFGIDLSYKRESTIAYSVFALDTKQGSHKMAGKYVGVGATATLGAGLGAHALIGGSDNSISLRPALEGSTGIGVSGGFTYLYLQAAK